MRPILLSLGPFPVYSLGFFSALAFLVGSFLFWRAFKDEAPEEDLLITSLLIAIFATLGSRTLPALASFLVKPTLDIFIRTFFSGQLSLIGAVLGGLLPLYLWQKSRFPRPWDLLDPLGSIFLSVATIVCLGTQLAGSWWGAPAPFLKVFGGIHPVSLYLSFWTFLGLLLTVLIKAHYRRWTWYKSGKVGLVGLFSFAWFALGFFLVASLVQNQLYWGPFAFNKILSLFVLVAIFIITWHRAGRRFDEFLKWLPRKNNY